MISGSTLITLISLVGVPLFPKVLAFYRSIRYAPKSQLRPPPPKVQTVLNVLYVIILIHLVRTLPVFQPENIFTTTGSRLFYPTASLFNSRVAALRPNNVLTDFDTALKRKLGGDDQALRGGRLMYAAYGPQVVADCLFCSPEQPETYLYYAIPAIVLPHLVHSIIWGSLTSSMLGGPEAKRWRTLAMSACIAALVTEVYLTWSFDPMSNLEKQGPLARPNNTRWFYWEAYTYRQLLFAVVDGLLAALLYLASTNRMLVRPASTAQELHELNQMMIKVLTPFNLLNPARIAIRQDPQASRQSEEFWGNQQRFVEEVEQQRDVVGARNIALSKQDGNAKELQIRNYVDVVFEGAKQAQAQQQAQRQQTVS